MQALGEVPPEAKKVLKELKEKKAQSLFKIAKFYERQKLYKSAVIYYEEIVKKYPKTSWAPKALERIEELKREKKVKE
jgi:outer membrane protein assembly factor BamD (BamD/ComL family)